MKVMLFLTHPAHSHVSSSNVSQQSTQEYADSSFDMYEADQQTIQHNSPARVRWLQAFNKVCAELSEGRPVGCFSKDI
ncbi:hypothetical protein ACOMHN_001174 [Nucella lapillus]